MKLAWCRTQLGCVIRQRICVVRRYAFIAICCHDGYCWANTLVPSPPFPCPSKWGWVKVANDMWVPLWMTIPQASQSCQELLICSCKSERGCANAFKPNCRIQRCAIAGWAVRPRMNNRMSDEQICVSLVL